MPDAIDQAQALEEAGRDASLAAWTAKRKRADYVASRERCVTCDEPIPPRRRELVPGVQTCVDCQSQLEGR